MPNIKSAIKRVKTDKIKRDRNRSRKSELKTQIKKNIRAIKDNDLAKAQQLLKKTFSLLDKSAQKNLIHKNTANRIKAKLSRKIEKISV